MLRAPIWMTSACSATRRRGSRVSSSVTTGSPVSARASARISRPATPSPLNANGDVRGLKAPPRSIDAPASRDRARDLERLLARLDRARPGDQREGVAAADAAAGDVDDGRLVVGELGAGQLVGPRDRDDAVDARPCPPGRARRTPCGIADRADRGRQLARQHEHVDADRLQPLAHGRDLRLGGLGCHHDHHRPSSRTPSSSAPRWCASSWRTVRSTCARSSSASWPKSRSSVSRKITMRSLAMSRATVPPW